MKLCWALAVLLSVATYVKSEGKADPSFVYTHQQPAQRFSQIVYRNPFEHYLQPHRNVNHQSPVIYSGSNPQTFAGGVPQHPTNFYPAPPQFVQPAGQQPLVFHPNTRFDHNQGFGVHAGNHLVYSNQQGASKSRFESPYQNLKTGNTGFNRGHVEFHPQREQVQTYTSFRNSEDEDSSLMSRSAVESVPIIAEAYTGFHSEDDSVLRAHDEYAEPTRGAFDRGNVEALPANMLRYDGEEEEDSFNSIGQAGFRGAVESRPMYIDRNDLSQAYSIKTEQNIRDFGHQRAFGTDESVMSYNALYTPRDQKMDPMYKLVCYYESWAIYRPAPQQYTIDRIDPFACTHLMYSFAGLDAKNFSIISLNPEYDIVSGGYKSIVALKAQNPDLKVMISIGGWNEGGMKYSKMVSTAENRMKFVESAYKFVEDNHFDGLDLNWEYPGASDRGGRATDKENFGLLVQELNAKFKSHPSRELILSSSASAARFRINEGYDVPIMSQYLDFINVITYDLRGPWDGRADHHAPVADKEIDGWSYRNLNVHDGLDYWVQKGADPKKLLMGIPFYARSFTLADPADNKPGARVKSGGRPGPFTGEADFLAYYEACSYQRLGWEMNRDALGGPYITKGNQWVGFDDPQYIGQKLALLRAKGYGGVMVWALDLDDQLGMCGPKSPLMTAVRTGLGESVGSSQDNSQMPSIQQLNEMMKPKPEEDMTDETKPEEPKPEPEPEPEPKPTQEPSTTTTTRDTTVSTPTLSESTSDTQTSPVSKPTECTQNGEKIPDPTNCQFYLECIYKEYKSRDCGAGLHWNNGKKICDWPNKAGCGIPGGAISVTPPSPTIGGGSIGGSGSSGGTTMAPYPQVDLEKVHPTGTLADDYMVVCYFTNWAWYRPGIGKYKPEDIDAELCTHIVYGFAVLDYSNLVIKMHDSWADLDNKFYEKVTALKRKGVKVTIAIGGWNDSAGDKYSRLVNNPAARAKFNRHVVEFIETHNFDGLDLDWEYPKCWQVDCKKGPDSDKAAFAEWTRELSELFKPRGWLLSAAVSPSKKVIDAGYDVPALNKYLDWIAVMTYDYHGQWDKKTGHVAPSYHHPEDDYDYFNMDYTIRYWMEKGASRSKLVLGMPMYGQSFTLNNPSVNGLNAPARTGGTAGEYTRAKGFLAYYEICDRIKNRGWQVVQDPQRRMGPYAYKGNQWVGFDDVETIRSKSEYIRRMGLRGGMIWALDLDDFRNECGQGAHPLLNTIKNVLGFPRGTSSIDNAGDTGPVAVSPDTSGDFGQSTPIRDSSSVTPPEVVTPIVDVAYPGTSGVGPSAGTDDYKVVCYFTNWAWYRQGEGKYLPSDIDPSLCTHIVYGFAVLDNNKLLIKPHDTWADFDNKFYEKVTSFKANGVKVLIAIGGWNDSRGPKYSKLVNSPSARRKFTEHVIAFIQKYNFDGLDLDWEYPKCWQVDCKKGPDSDKDAFSAWVKELHEAFQPLGLLLSAAVSPSNKVIDAGYDVPVLSRYLDWIAVMTYDYHGQWDKKTGHVAPMYMHPMDDNPFFNTNYTINYWLELGAHPKKLVLGMPMYGQSFTLSQTNNQGLNQKTYGGGEAGPYTRARGFLAYYEICYNILNKGWTVVRDEYETMGPYAYKGNQWVGFDDKAVIEYKSDYIKRMGLGGGMIWALDLDDFRNRCGCGKYPLLKTINNVLRNMPSVSCPVLGGGSPTKLLPFGSEPHDRITTTVAPTTLPPWMTTRKTPVPAWKTTTTTRRPTTTTRRTTTRAPWLPPQTTRRTTTRAPWLPPQTTARTTTRAPWLPPQTTVRTTTRPPWMTPSTTQSSTSGKQCEVAEYRPHSDCTKFYECNHGKLVEKKCFPGLHWSPTGNRCTWPKDAKCETGAGAQPTLPPASATSPPWRPEATTRPPWLPPATTTRPVVTSRPGTMETTTRRIYQDARPGDYKVVCYFTNWAWYRRGIGKYKPEDIDPELCTHIVYGFAVLDGNTLKIKPHDRWADLDSKFYEKVTALKQYGIKVLIAIGGWNDSLGSKYSRLVNNPTARRIFTAHVIEFMMKHNFDGLDLDWEYPKCWQVDCSKGPDSDKPAFSAWIKELYEAFQPHGLLLSAAVSPNHKVIDAGYEVPQLNKYLDWIAVMTYDYHGHWDKRTGHVAPMYHYRESQEPKFNANYTIHYWLQLGADRKKLVMGMPLYGQAFTLSKASENGYNVTARQKGQAGQYTRAAGFLSYYEICHKVTREGYTVVKDPERTIGPYAYKGTQWVGYDDVDMIRQKSQYIIDMGLGGGMIWALDLDDFKNRCGCEEHPLLRTINRVLRNYNRPDPGCDY